jgi:hypothetical protein
MINADDTHLLDTRNSLGFNLDLFSTFPNSFNFSRELYFSISFM